MKVIIRESEEFVLGMEDVDSSYIYVSAPAGMPSILTADSYERGPYSFRCLEEEFTEGNSYNDFESVREAVESMVKQGYEVQAFKTWREALQWLLDNAEGY